MKPIFFKLFIVGLILCTTSCHAQKMVKKASDAKKLQINKEQFIGKPLSALLDQIGPTIKYVYGNPENTWAGATGGTYLRFLFIAREQSLKERTDTKRSTEIIVNFPLDTENKHKPLPKEGLKSWSAENKKEYGDMIVLNIRVIGDN